MRKVVSETSLRYHVEGTDDIYAEYQREWSFLGSSNYLSLPASSRSETAEKIARKYEGEYRRVRIVDTQAEEN